MADALQRLEEKIAYLEHHVVEQDKVMLEMSRHIDRLQQELGVLRDRMAEAKPAESMLRDEKPPHY